jgi:hypothetical protein
VFLVHHELWHRHYFIIRFPGPDQFGRPAASIAAPGSLMLRQCLGHGWCGKPLLQCEVEIGAMLACVYICTLSWMKTKRGGKHFKHNQKTKTQFSMHSWVQAARRTRGAAQCISGLFSACGSIREPSGLDFEETAFWRKCQIGFRYAPEVLSGIPRKSGVLQGSLYLSRESLGNSIFPLLLKTTTTTIWLNFRQNKDT